jgi:proline-specific peptidase
MVTAADVDPPIQEGYVSFAGYRTWYRIAGEGEVGGKLPLLCLHGGPGATWHHMAPYENLAEGRRVVFYDQLGCGNSAVGEPHDSSLWTVELYLEEIDTIRQSLGLERCHILGHSWGGMLAMAYAAKRPNGLRARRPVRTSLGSLLALRDRSAARWAPRRGRGDTAPS